MPTNSGSCLQSTYATPFCFIREDKQAKPASSLSPSAESTDHGAENMARYGQTNETEKDDAKYSSSNCNNNIDYEKRKKRNNYNDR